VSFVVQLFLLFTWGSQAPSSLFLGAGICGGESGGVNFTKKRLLQQLVILKGILF